MSRFYFHIRQGKLLFEDKQGAHFPDLAAAWEWAVQDARALMGQGTLAGPIEEHWVEIPTTRALRWHRSLSRGQRYCIDRTRQIAIQSSCPIMVIAAANLRGPS
jgi:hypothetical protein